MVGGGGLITGHQGWVAGFLYHAVSGLVWLVSEGRRVGKGAVFFPGCAGIHLWCMGVWSIVCPHGLLAGWVAAPAAGELCVSFNNILCWCILLSPKCFFRLCCRIWLVLDARQPSAGLGVCTHSRNVCEVFSRGGTFSLSRSLYQVSYIISTACQTVEWSKLNEEFQTDEDSSPWSA